MAEDVQHLHRCQRLRVAGPEQLASLTTAERDMALRGHGHQFGVAQLAEQPIPFAHQIVADVERDRHADFGVQRGAVVSLLVAILDVVVNQRGLVKALDRNRCLVNRLGQHRVGVLPV